MIRSDIRMELDRLGVVVTPVGAHKHWVSIFVPSLVRSFDGGRGSRGNDLHSILDTNGTNGNVHWPLRFRGGDARGGKNCSHFLIFQN